MEIENTFFKDYQNLINSFEALKKEADNPFFKSKYVPLNAILPIVKKKCTEHNFILMQMPVTHEGKNFLRTVIEHKDGDNIEGQIEIVAKDQTDPQKVGGGLTYARRYSLTCMFGLEEEDDDGNKASQPYTTQKPQNATTGTKPQYPNNDDKEWITDVIFNAQAKNFNPNSTPQETMTKLRQVYKVAKSYEAKVERKLKEMKEIQDASNNVANTIT